MLLPYFLLLLPAFVTAETTDVVIGMYCNNTQTVNYGVIFKLSKEDSIPIQKATFKNFEFKVYEIEHPKPLDLKNDVLHIVVEHDCDSNGKEGFIAVDIRPEIDFTNTAHFANWTVDLTNRFGTM